MAKLLAHREGDRWTSMAKLLAHREGDRWTSMAKLLAHREGDEMAAIPVSSRLMLVHVIRVNKERHS